MSIGKKLPDVFLRTISAIILAPIVLFVIYLGGMAYNLFLGIVSSVLLYEAGTMYWKNSKKISLKKSIVCLAMLLFICLAMYFLYIIRSEQYGFEIIVWLIISVWICDIFAYLTGNIVKGPKILPRISPSKTWSGFIGGACATIVFSMIYKNIMDIQVYDIVFWSFLLGAIAHIGDFIESYYKRLFGVKDSGNIIPGHGGFLDRFDSILSVSCFVMLVKSIS